jgi:hypothetical protein
VVSLSSLSDLSKYMENKASDLSTDLGDSLFSGRSGGLYNDDK